MKDDKKLARRKHHVRPGVMERIGLERLAQSHQSNDRVARVGVAQQAHSTFGGREMTATYTQVWDRFRSDLIEDHL